MESKSQNNSTYNSFLMRLEVIFLVKKQTELEKSSMKRKMTIIF